MILPDWSRSAWLRALAEALKCLALGLREALSPRILFRSAVLCIAAFVLWVWIYIHFSAEITLVLGKAALLSMLGLFLGGFLGLIPASLAPQGGASITQMGNIPIGFAYELLRIGQILVLVAAVIAAIYVLMFLVGVATTIRVTLPRLLMRRAAEKVLKKYPERELVQAESLAGKSKPWWRIALILLLCLCIPFVAGVVLFLGICYANAWLLYHCAARRMPSPALEMRRLQWRWRPLLWLGVLLLLLAVVPVINLLVPALMCTSILHLICRDNAAPLAPAGPLSEPAASVLRELA